MRVSSRSGTRSGRCRCTASPSTRSRRTWCARRWRTRAKSAWTSCRPGRRGGRWTTWWATAAPRCCGASCRAAVRRAACSRWRSDSSAREAEIEAFVPTSYWTVEAESTSKADLPFRADLCRLRPCCPRVPTRRPRHARRRASVSGSVTTSVPSAPRSSRRTSPATSRRPSISCCSSSHATCSPPAAIKEADDSELWTSTDHASDAFVSAICEGADGHPWNGPVSALPIPDRFTERGAPPVVTLTGARPPGAIDISGGTVGIRFVDNAATVTTELSDPPPPPGNKPLVTFSRRTDRAPDGEIRGGKDLVRVEGWSNLHGIDQAG